MAFIKHSKYHHQVQQNFDNNRFTWRASPKNQEDNLAVQSPPRVLEESGSSQSSMNTSQETTEFTPLVPAIIPTPRKTLTPTVSQVLELLLTTQDDTANNSRSTVMEQLQGFFC